MRENKKHSKMQKKVKNAKYRKSKKTLIHKVTMGYVEAMSKQSTCCNGTIDVIELIPKRMRNDSFNGLLYSEEYNY